MKPKLPTPTIIDGRTLFTAGDLRQYAYEFAKYCLETRQKPDLHDKKATLAPDFLSQLFKK